MNDKILPQMLDILRASPLMLPVQLEVCLQAAAWAELSRRGELSEGLHLTPSLIADANRLSAALNDLANIGELFAQAFVAMGQVDYTSAPVRAVFELALQLANAGVLQGFDATDAITALPGNRFGEWSLPPDLASLMVHLAALLPGARVYTPWDVGAQIASRAKTGETTVFLESPVRSAIPALVSLLTGRPMRIRFSDPIDAPSFIENGKPQRFEVGISFPPMGHRYSWAPVERDWFGRFKERTLSGGVLAIRHLLAQVDGRVVVAVPNNLTFSPGAERALREDLISRGMVRAVIAMPAGLLESTMLAFTILILEPTGGRDKIQFINAAEGPFVATGSRGRSRLADPSALLDLVEKESQGEFSRLVSNEEVLENEAQLQASRYVVPGFVKELKSKLEGVPTVALADIAITARPMPTTKGLSGAEVGEIRAADIPAYGYIAGPGRTIQVVDTPKDRKNFLRPLDIVLIVKGSVGKVGIVPMNVPPPGPGGWVAGQSAIILRVEDERMDPRSLALQLRSPFGQQLLKQIVSGATISLIQLRELMRLNVLLPDNATAAAAAGVLEKECELQKQITGLQKKLAEVAANLWLVG